MGTVVGPDPEPELPVAAGSQVADVGGGEVVGGSKLDAGALFVLKSKGSWLHCGYHLTTSIVAPALLSLPFALASLGWGAGIFCLAAAAAVTFYSYNLLSMVLEHHAQRGSRLLRFRDLAFHVLGPKWARYYIGPIQFLCCYGAVVGSTLLGGQCMKSIYMISSPADHGQGGGTRKLYEFVALFGICMLILAQIPSFHSLRHVNLISLALCLCYSACTTAGSIHAGKSLPKDYSLPTQGGQDRLFGACNAIAIIATTYGNGIIPEIQATAAPPVKGKMFKGLCLCYTVVVSTFFSVAISGYWAFGSKAQAVILSNLVVVDGKALLPKWFLLMTYTFALLQLSAVAVVYLQPTNEVLEGLLADPKKGQYSRRNVVPRVVSRSLSIVVATTFGAMLPFFGDMAALIGAVCFLPLDFVVPSIAYNITFGPSKKDYVFWLNTAIATVFSAFSVVGSISAVRQIALDAKQYRLFANV